VSGALAGLRVIDCSPVDRRRCARDDPRDHDADVIKVENPRGGDPLRTWLRDRGELWWKVYARGKRSVTLNLAHARGQALLRRLCRDADVLIENYVPRHVREVGTRLGRALRREPPPGVRPRLGWGQDGPYRDRPGFGTMVEAMSGFASVDGSSGSPPDASVVSDG
jgi:formyl-CoA transferase